MMAVTTSQRATARVVDIDWIHPVALPPHVTLELIEQPQILAVPGSKLFLTGLLYWQQRWIPILNIRALLLGADRPIDSKYCLVVTYKSQQSSVIQFGGIITNKIVQNIPVNNEDFCELPRGSLLWQKVAKSSFLLNGQAIPIIDTTALFGFNNI